MNTESKSQFFHRVQYCPPDVLHLLTIHFYLTNKSCRNQLAEIDVNTNVNGMVAD